MRTLARHRSQATTSQLAATPALSAKHVQRRMNTGGILTTSNSTDAATLESGSQRGGWGAHAFAEPQAQAWGGGWGNPASSSSSADDSGGWGAHAADSTHTNKSAASQPHDEGAWGGKSGGVWGAPRRARIEEEEAASITPLVV